MSIDRKRTYAGLGAMGSQKLPDERPSGVTVNIPTVPGGDLQWFQLIGVHLNGLGDRLAPLKKDTPNAIISVNPIDKIEKLMNSYFGHLESLQLHCSQAGGKELDPAKFYEYLTQAFLKIVKIIEGKDAQCFYSAKERALILENCQRNLCFMAAILPGVSTEFEKFVSDPANGGVVPGRLEPLKDDGSTGFVSRKTQPYLSAVSGDVASAETVPASEAAPASSNARRSSIPINANQLYPAQARRKTVRPTAAPSAERRAATLLGLDEQAQQFQENREVVDLGDVIIGVTAGEALPDESHVHVGITTSMLPPPMVEAIAEQEMQRNLETTHREALREFEKLFVSGYEAYFQEYQEKHAIAEKLLNSEAEDPVKKEQDIQEGERLIEGLRDLMIDPEEIATMAFGIAVETMDNNSADFPHFTEYFLEQGRVDYREQFKQHLNAVFAEKSRVFVEQYLPAILAKRFDETVVKSHLRLYNRTIWDTKDAGQEVSQDLRDIDSFIQQIREKDATILFEDWPDKLASAMASQFLLTLGEKLYLSKKADQIWGLYFYQANKRELAEQLYQPIFDAYLPHCQNFQDELRPAVQENLARISADFAAEHGVDSGVQVSAGGGSMTVDYGEVGLSDEELNALHAIISRETTLETGEAELSDAEFAALGIGDEVDDHAITPILPPTSEGARISSTEINLRKLFEGFGGLSAPIKVTEIEGGAAPALDMSLYGRSVIFADGVDYEKLESEKLPPLPAILDPATFMGDDKSFMKFVMEIAKSPDKVIKFRDYAFGFSKAGEFIMAKDGWILFKDKITEVIEETDEFGNIKEKKSDRVFGTWYFRPPNTLFPVRRPADGNTADFPMTMTVEDVQVLLNKEPRNLLRALYMKSFENSEGIADPFEGMAEGEFLFEQIMKDPFPASEAPVTVMPDPFPASEVVTEVLTQGPTIAEELGYVEGDRPTPVNDLSADEITLPNIRTLEKRRSEKRWKMVLAAAAMAAAGVVGYGGFKAAQTDSTESPVASSSASNSDGAKPVESAKVAEVKSAQPQTAVTAPPAQPKAPSAAIDINDLPLRTYVSNEVLAKIPSEYTRKVVETGKFTVEGNGLGWAAQIATPFTRIASPKQQAKINELMHELNVGLYASSVKKYENAANVNAILMDPKNPEYARVKFLVKPNVMGNPYEWDWKIFTRNTGKSWDVQAAFEYYQTFEKEAMDRNMDRHSPGVLHQGAWGGDVVDVYKDSKFMTYMVDVAAIVDIDLTPPTTGSVDPSILQKMAPGAPGFVPGIDVQPGAEPGIQNKTGFLSPDIPGNLHFGFDSFYGNSVGAHKLPQYTFDFKHAAHEEPASFDVDLSELETGVLALAGVEDISVDVDLSELNGNTLAASALDGSIDVDVSSLDALSEEDAFDAAWNTIANQHEAQKTVPSIFEKASQVKNNRREALMKRGEVWVPALSEDMSGSAMMAFENGFLKECTSVSQQQKVRALLSKIRMGNLEEYEVLEDGSTYAKLNEKDMEALRTALNEPSYEDELASIDAGWDDVNEQTPESELIVDVSRKIHQKLGVIKLSV